jgi:hypothetical protein
LIKKGRELNPIARLRVLEVFAAALSEDDKCEFFKLLLNLERQNIRLHEKYKGCHIGPGLLERTWQN